MVSRKAISLSVLDGDKASVGVQIHPQSLRSTRAFYALNCGPLVQIHPQSLRSSRAHCMQFLQ
jgi:hypothetical protein